MQVNFARITKATGTTDRTLSQMKTGAARRAGRRARFLVSNGHLQIKSKDDVSFFQVSGRSDSVGPAKVTRR